MTNRIARSLFIATAASLPLQALAEHTELAPVLVEGELLRPGLISVNPGTESSVDAAELLKRIPGANVNRNGPLTGIAQYRGMYGDRVNVMVDGVHVKAAGPNSMDPPLSHIPAGLAGSLEVYRGIAPVSSGLETIGGSMVMKSSGHEFASGSEVESHGKLSAGYGDVDNSKRYSLVTSLANDSQRGHLAWSGEKGDSYNFDGNNTNYNTQYDRDAYALGYGFRAGDHEFGLDYSHNDTGHTGTPALPMDIVYARGGIISGDYSFQGDGFDLDAKVSYQDSEHLMSNYLYRDAPMMMGNPMNRYAYTTVDGGSYSFALTLPAYGGKMVFGLDGDQANHDADIYDPTNAMFHITNYKGVERDRVGFFTEWTGDIASSFNLEAGARVTQVSMDADDVSSSVKMGMMGALHQRLAADFNASDRSQDDTNIDLVLVLRQALSDTVDFEYGLARKTRSASYQERYLWLPLESTGGLADGRNYIGDVELDPEVSYQAEFGVNWHQGGSYLTPRVFYHYVNDYIQGTPTAAALAVNPQVLQFTNTDAKLYGIDAAMGMLIAEDWRLDGTLSYVRGKRRDTSDNLYRIAPLNGRVSVTYERPTWSAQVEAVGYASQDDVSEENSETKTGGYGLFNLRGEYLPTRQISLAFGVENFLDKKYEDHLGGYNRNNQNVDVGTTGGNQGNRLPGIGRNFYVTANYEW
ncbi:MAG: TonB-dependent receptor [Gammaproteobacteria bacterium]|nr:MAG: TonB-dependent receptor [Gammaproteobacteria bacterium]RLA22159.1 MAG: TonB-dependent receptor [Gammaproteobacteria bacterium]